MNGEESFPVSRCPGWPQFVCECASSGSRSSSARLLRRPPRIHAAQPRKGALNRSLVAALAARAGHLQAASARASSLENVMVWQANCASPRSCFAVDCVNIPKVESSKASSLGLVWPDQRKALAFHRTS